MVFLWFSYGNHHISIPLRRASLPPPFGSFDLRRLGRRGAGAATRGWRPDLNEKAMGIYSGLMGFYSDSMG